MNPQVNKAIMAHSSWKAKFRQFMSGELDLDPEVVCKSDVCEFGQWLKGDGRQELGSDFPEIDKLHKEFHRVAATVVRSKMAGNEAEAAHSLTLTGDFAKTSSALVSRLMQVP